MSNKVTTDEVHFLTAACRPSGRPPTSLGSRLLTPERTLLAAALPRRVPPSGRCRPLPLPRPAAAVARSALPTAAAGCLLPQSRPTSARRPSSSVFAASSTVAAASTSTSCASRNQYGEREKRDEAPASYAPRLPKNQQDGGINCEIPGFHNRIAHIIGKGRSVVVC